MYKPILNNKEDTSKFILENLEKHDLMALGTVDEKGKPWVVAVHFWMDKKLNLIWKSAKDTEHSKHIAQNPEVSICVFSHTADVGDFGFYTKAIAREVSDQDELAACLKIRDAKTGKTSSLDEHLGDSNFRIYLAEIIEAWTTQDKNKVKLDVEELRSGLK
jgi:uncharacterized protein YhbP (UPF0306 family)